MKRHCHLDGMSGIDWLEESFEYRWGSSQTILFQWETSTNSIYMKVETKTCEWISVLHVISLLRWEFSQHHIGIFPYHVGHFLYYVGHFLYGDSPTVDVYIYTSFLFTPRSSSSLRFSSSRSPSVRFCIRLLFVLSNKELTSNTLTKIKSTLSLICLFHSNRQHGHINIRINLLFLS